MSVDLDDVLDTLTPEERAAIEDTESAGELASKEPVDEAGDSDGYGEDDADEGDAAPVEGAAVATVAKTAAADTQEGTVDLPGSSREAPFVPRYQADMPADFQASVQALNEERAELTRRFTEGAVEQEEYDRKFSEINDQRDALLIARTKAEISSEMQAQTSAQRWNNEVNAFLDRSAATDGIDYRADQEKQNDLDMFVRRLGENPANGDRPMEWFLQEAHRRVASLHGIALSKPGAKAAASPEPRRVPASSIPKTLAQVPGSDGPGDIADEFADIDSLDGDDFEAALSRMTPKQREKFAAAGR